VIKILHVEDDADIREIAEMALSLSGDFHVVQSESGEDALKMVQTLQPDVLLLDVMMPGMTGRQTLERMREVPCAAHIPAIFMTARAQQTDIDELLESGAVKVISKPFDPLSLGAQIRSALEDLAQNQPDKDVVA
jgi:CheY-like chemotaxis protein